jgi:hypothetical protein
MRAGIGLLVILITVALMLYLYTATPGGGNASYLQTVATANKNARATGNVWNGMDSSGTVKVTDTIQIKQDGNKFLVVGTVPGGPADVRFGFMPNDRIVQVGPLDMRDASAASSEQDVLNQIHDAYARNWTITVEREGKRVELPTVAHQYKMKKSGQDATVTAPLGIGTH